MKRIALVFLLFLAGVIVVYMLQTKKQKENEEQLSIINPIDLDPEMVDPELLRIGFGHTIGAFRFQNQEGKFISDKDLKGKIFVAEYFFTSCGTICPKMNVQLQRVHKVFKENDEVRLLSFTVDPEVDNVAQMQRYAAAHGADPNRWYFLTGKKKELYELARKSFFVLKPAEAENQGDVGSDFIHTNNFVLVDRKMRIRGYYDGTSESEVDQLITDIRVLLKEK